MIDETFYTVDEVAKSLRVSRMTVYRLVNNAELGHVRVGRTFRIPRHALEAFILANAVTAEDHDL
jgi:excisionase family DNA binding protein